MKKELIAVFALVVLFSSNANASQVRLSFEGTITDVYAGTYSPGQKISGIVIYDPGTPMTPAVISGPPFTLGAEHAIDSFLMNNRQVDNVTDNGVSLTAFLNQTNTYGIGFFLGGWDTINNYESLDLSLYGPDLLGSIGALPQNLDPARVTSGYFNLHLWNGPVEDNSWGTVDSLQVTTVPIPAAGLLFGSGLASIATLKRRFRRSLA